MNVSYTMAGQVVGGKNNLVVTRSGLHFPRKEFAQWRDAQVFSLRAQRTHTPLTSILSMTVGYYAGDKKTRDIPAILDAIFHCLERAEVVVNDSQIKHVMFSTSLDKANPRAVLNITELPSETVIWQSDSAKRQAGKGAQ
jgi:Holliday junction resolvase RusA-like endonuclease